MKGEDREQSCQVENKTKCWRQQGCFEKKKEEGEQSGFRL